MNIEMFRKLYDNFDTNTNVDYKQLVFMYEKYLERYIFDNSLNENTDFLICITVGFDYIHKYFGLDEEIDIEEINSFIEEKNNSISKSIEEKKIDIANLSYLLGINCLYLLNDEDEIINEQIKLVLIKNSYIINKTLLKDKEKTNKLS